MPIYDLSYRHWEGSFHSPLLRWWTIARRGMALLARRRNFLVLLILAQIPFLIRGIMIYGYFFSERLNLRIPYLQIDGKFYYDFLRWQMFWVFVVLLYAGAGLIAHDLRTNALQIYFSKPISRLDYLLGKLGVAVVFTGLVTLLPALLLFLLHMIFAGDWSVLAGSLGLLAGIGTFSLLLILTNSLMVLALSSLSRNSRFVGLIFFAVYFFTEAIVGILRVITRDTQYAFLSLQSNFWRLGQEIFQQPATVSIEAWQSGLALLLLTGLSLTVLFWRIRPVEVVK